MNETIKLREYTKRMNTLQDRLQYIKLRMKDPTMTADEREELLTELDEIEEESDTLLDDLLANVPLSKRNARGTRK